VKLFDASLKALDGHLCYSRYWPNCCRLALFAFDAENAGEEILNPLVSPLFFDCCGPACPIR
jgi:hypothetical protein